MVARHRAGETVTGAQIAREAARGERTRAEA
jgi:hypothetical protein